MTIRSYLESGKTNPTGELLSYVVLFLACIPFCYLYTVIQVIFPLIYFNILFTIMLGTFLGWTNRLASRWACSRNKNGRLIRAIAAGVFACYFQWTAYILYAYSGELPMPGEYLSNLFIVADPAAFFQTLTEINQTGMWSVFGATVRGSALTVVWLVEAVIIIGIPVWMVLKAPVFPFSELLRKWYPKYTLLTDFEVINGSDSFMQKLTIDPLQTIAGLGKGRSNSYSEIHIFYLKDEEPQYLTIDRVFIEERGRGKRKTSNTVSNLTVSKTTAETLLANYRYKKERTEII